MIVYSDKFLLHDMQSHVENAKRLKVILSFLEEKRILKKIKIIEPEEAGEEQITKVHTEEHLKFVKAISEEGGMVFGDTYVTPYTYEVAKLAAGAAIKCVSLAKPCFALLRPPGHHASSNSLAGFCIFNNAAIAANFALEKGYKKIAIFDFDLHHGNGTQDIFYESDNVLYCSTHEENIYPGTGYINEIGAKRGEGFNINFPMPANTGEKSYLKAFSKVIIPVIKQFKPELIIVSAGYDAHYLDFLGSLNLRSLTYYRIAEELKKINKNIIFLLEGGYNYESLSESVYASMLALFSEKTGKEKSLEELKNLKHNKEIESENTDKIIEKRIEEVRNILKDYWEV